MNEPDDPADLNVLKAPLPSRREVDGLQQLRFQLLGYATALAVLVVLTPTWLITDWGSNGLRLRSGLGMVKDGAVLHHAGTYLFVAYLVLALVALARPATIPAFVCAYAGLVDTIAILLLKPDSGRYTDIGWTGAPVLAAGLWLVLAVVNHIGWYETS